MNLQDLKSKFYKNKWPTPLGWIILAAFIFAYLFLKQGATNRRAARNEGEDSQRFMMPGKAASPVKNVPFKFGFPDPGLPEPSIPVSKPQKATPPSSPIRPLNQPSFGNLAPSNKILSDDFLPKGTILHAILTSDIVSNNQVSPATATIIHPVIFAHRLRIPVGTQITGKIAPGNLRGRVFVTWDTLIFYDEGRQGWELPIKGIGMAYEENPHSGRWIINGAGLKGHVFDDSTANAYKLAGLRAMQDFSKTLQTYVTSQSTAMTAGSVVTTSGTTPEATLQNSGLAAMESFIDVIASRYSATLQQQNSYVLVPTSRLCAIFLDDPIDLTNAAPGRSIQTKL